MDLLCCLGWFWSRDPLASAFQVLDFQAYSPTPLSFTGLLHKNSYKYSGLDAQWLKWYKVLSSYCSTAKNKTQILSLTDLWHLIWPCPSSIHVSWLCFPFNNDI
jgi:hypothetical protein